MPEKDKNKALDLVKIIREAKKAGVSEMKISPNGEIEVKFGSKQTEEIQETKGNIGAMGQIANEALDEEETLLKAENFNELDLVNPELVEQLIQQGEIVEKPDGELVKAE